MNTFDPQSLVLELKAKCPLIVMPEQTTQCEQSGAAVEQCLGIVPWSRVSHSDGNPQTSDFRGNSMTTRSAAAPAGPVQM